MDQDDVIILSVLVILDHFIIESIYSLIISDLFVAKLHEKRVGAVRAFIVDRVFQVVEILADPAGECLLEDLIIFEDLFLGECKECLFQGCLDLFFSINIASADAGDCVVIFFKLFFNF